MKALDKLKIENEAGEVAEVTRKEYIAHVVKEHSVEAYTTEANGTTAPDKVVTYILKTIEAGQDLDEGIAGEYGELILAIQEDVTRTTESQVDKKALAEAEKAKKAEEKAAREAEEAKAKAELATTQNEFAKSAIAGADQAAEEFKDELTELAGSLKDGVKVVAQGGGYGLEFASDADKETVGSTLGYLLQKSQNSTFIGNQIQFWIGDTIKLAVDRGIYATASEAGKHIAGVISQTTGKAVEPISLDQYKRMAERTPIEFRNPKVDQTAYLAITQMKVPRKEATEKDEAFKARLDAFNADREGLQKKLAVGEITKRKDIVPLRDAVAIKHGMMKAPDETPQVSIGQQFQLFFHASYALENLLGVHEPDVAKYKDGNDIVTVTKDELEEIKASALAHLVNAQYNDVKNGITPLDFSRGYVTKTVKTEVAKDAEGKPIMEESPVKNLVYPRAFYSAPKPEAAPAPEA
jgi:hypothetical protein